MIEDMLTNEEKMETKSRIFFGKTDLDIDVNIFLRMKRVLGRE